MRIIGGKLRGKTVNPPAGYKARPTTDFAREGLFNVLDNEYEFEDLKVLDLFGGTGAVAFEFASRGGGEGLVCGDGQRERVVHQDRGTAAWSGQRHDGEGQRV